MQHMNYVDAVILGIIEGIAEFLPISSTGHLILTSHLLGIPNSDFLTSFEIIIQLGAICAVLVLFWRSFLSVPIITRLLCGFLPTAVIGFTLYPFVKGYLLGNPLIVVIALALGGLFLIIFELLHTENDVTEQKITDITYKQAFLIGLFQSVALVPGVSRSAATIVGGLLMGLKRVTIVEFSFLLAVPTMTAATSYDILKNYSLFSAETIPLLLTGFITAFFVALLVITLLLQYIKKHTFIPFGIYRILLAAIFFWFIL
jgi:undecaprenyl-diphosphatase